MSIPADQKVIDDINNMSHIEMARIWRFTPSGHFCFDSDLPYFEIFKKRFEDFGGMTPEIFKEIGWGDIK